LRYPDVTKTYEREECFLTSADWMERNLDRRVELAFPVLGAQLQAQLRDFLEVQLADNVKGRLLQPDGTSRRLCPGDGGAVRSQERVYELIGALTSGMQPVLTE
jgi:polyphosphate kinase